MLLLFDNFFHKLTNFDLKIINVLSKGTLNHSVSIQDDSLSILTITLLFIINN